MRQLLRNIRKRLEAVRIYIDSLAGFKRKYSSKFSVVDAAIKFPRWWYYLNSGSLDDRQPWMVFSAIDFLDRVLEKNMSVFEYGSGGSTLFFADRVSQVVSVEHNPEWHARVAKRLGELGIANCSLFLAEPAADPATAGKDYHEPGSYVSSDAHYAGMSFREYASKIDAYPDRHFDLVVIDGRSRASCFKHSVNKVKSGGYLVLDNSDVEDYSRIIEALDGQGRSWRKRVFRGPIPYVPHFCETTVWKRL